MSPDGDFSGWGQCFEVITGLTLLIR